MEIKIKDTLNTIDLDNGIINIYEATKEKIKLVTNELLYGMNFGSGFAYNAGSAAANRAKLKKIIFRTPKGNTSTIIANSALTSYSYHIKFLSGYSPEEIIIEPGYTEIESQAFTRNDYIRSVKIADTVKVIGELAFMMCPRLTSIELSSSVEKIGNLAFSNTPLQNITLYVNSNLWFTDSGSLTTKSKRKMSSLEVRGSGYCILMSCAKLTELTIKSTIIPKESETKINLQSLGISPDYIAFPAGRDWKIGRKAMPRHAMNNLKKVNADPRVFDFEDAKILYPSLNIDEVINPVIVNKEVKVFED